MSTIIFTGGGTAGHCMPHLAVYPLIKSKFERAVYLGSKEGIERKIMEKEFEYFPITTAKLKRELTLDNLLIPKKVLKGIREAKKILQEIKPDLVFSKGGFVAVPVVIAAKKLNIPVVCHESDLSMGLANRITAKKCEYVLTSFPKTAEKLKNGVFTGPPIRKFYGSKSEGLKKFGLKQGIPVLLVIGGSLGSVKINEAVRNALDRLLKDFQILHVTGKNNLSGIKREGYKEIEFAENVGLLYKTADIALSRAGAGVSFELLSEKIPTLFIPLSKKASRGDQILNAQYFLSKGLCRVLEEENLTSDYLATKISQVFSARESIKRQIALEPTLSGNEKIAEILLSFA